MEFAAALSVMSIFAISRHGIWDTRALIAASVILVLLSAAMRMKKDPWVILKIIPFLAFIFFLNVYKYDAGGGAMANLSLGWPWYAPLGCLVMVLSAMLICEPKGPEQSQAQTA
jgi:hypothetical protein